ncbi:RNA-binding protein 7 [Microcaecilia unicolor]|uniref:RNA-binding protein 7 n=1 Tax=Microcaecilia unicolor TaxID=1415580 RepID=A0A6P7ZPW7_9AMPH|nr:RNA-binding protein 7 [Microcaecilia unicolor]
MGAAEADRTLFVGNLDPRVTEELLFELFHQAGPVIKVKIPKDKDGKAKLFAFVNFKHEESVPYGMNLLTGIRLFGRPLKIQFRSGSSHASQDGNNPSYSPHASDSASPTNIPSPAMNCNRFERALDNMVPPAFTASQMIQRSFSSPDNLQRQAVMNNVLWQQQPQLSPMSQLSPIPQHSVQSGFTLQAPQQQQQYHHSFNQNLNTQRWQDSAAQRKNRQSSHPYQSESRQYNREQHSVDQTPEHRYRGSRDDFSYEGRVQDGWSQDYDQRRENCRDGKWRPSRH